MFAVLCIVFSPWSISSFQRDVPGRGVGKTCALSTAHASRHSPGRHLDELSLLSLVVAILACVAPSQNCVLYTLMFI